jgi:CRISPR/Cas system-associated exonuclease Cas4 (RecB family)
MGKSIVQKIKKQESNVFDTIEKFDEVTEEGWMLEVEDGPLSGLTEAIEEGYRKDNVPKHMQKKTFAPSTLVWNHGVCPRYWYLAFEGNTFFEYKTGKMITNMDSGTDRHSRIQKAMEDAGILIDSERKTVYDDPPIFGYVDSFIDWKEAEYIVEIKTTNQDSFDRHKRSNSASTYHILQLLIYMKIYKKKNGIIIYENKNTHELLAIPVNINQKHVDFVDYLFGWMQDVYAAWTNKTLPEVPFKNNDIKICQACPLQQACKDAPKGDVKIARRKDEKGQF